MRYEYYCTFYLFEHSITLFIFLQLGVSNILYPSFTIPFQAFFAATDQILHAKDVTYETEVDAEIIGVGTITAFTIISPMLLLAYALYGRKAVQGTHLDILFCFVGAIMFITAGGNLIFFLLDK